jgi:3-methyladenine DNA glycosylase AlkD
MHIRHGAVENCYGVKMGDIRVVAKEIKANTNFAKLLWATGNHEAMLLAVLLAKPKELTSKEIDHMVHSAGSAPVLDWLNSYVVKAHPEKESLRSAWMQSAEPLAARSGWSLTTERVIKDPAGLDLTALLDRIEAEMADAHEFPKWNMNYCLAEIGINHPHLRDRALSIGERIGAYRDYPTPKGCTSPFAPIWINEMVRRQSL